MNFLYFFIIPFAVINADNKVNDDARDWIESSDYVKVSQTPYYVDKTQYIRRVMADSKYVEFCAPKKFTKSTFLSMLDNFLSLEIDENGKKTNEPLKSASFNLFRNKAVFRNKQGNPLSDEEIKKDDLFRLHFQNHPVIHADFSSIRGTTYHFLLRSVHDAIVDACNRHEYILRNDTLWLKEYEDEDKKFFIDQYFTPRSDDDLESISDSSINRAFLDLSEKLYQHFGKKVIVLIDEVNAPTISALFRESFSVLDIERIDPTMKSLLKLICKHLGASQYIEKVIVTSILSLSAALSYEPTNLKRFHFLQNEQYKFLFGFTRQEVEKTIKKNVKSLSTKIKNYNEKGFFSTAAAWYNGYESHSNVSIYNPWSMMNLMTKGKFRRYRAISLNQRNFIRRSIHPKILPTIWRLLNHEYVEMKIMESSIETISIPDLFTLRKILLEGKVFTPSLFFKYLCEYGFLSCKVLDDDKMGMKIPNYEIHSLMDDIIFSNQQASAVYAIPSHLTNRVGETFITLTNDDAERSVQKLADDLCLLHRTMPSIFQKAAKGSVEDFNVCFVEHNFKWALYVILNQFFPTIEEGSVQRVLKEKSVPGGRIDVVLTTHGVTFIIELKYDGDSKVATNQCLKKNYQSLMSELPNTGDKRYMLLGINFHKNKNRTVDISYLFDTADENSIKTKTSQTDSSQD